MFTQLVSVLESAMNQHLEGWSIRTLKFWVNAEGVDYCEANIRIGEDELYVRLRGHENTIRLVAVELNKPSSKGGKVISSERSKGR